MAKKMKSPLELPQTDDLWYCAVRKLRTFVPSDDIGNDYFRPFIILVADMKTSMLLMVDIVREPITAVELNSRLVGVILNPPKGTGIQAHRPSEIHFEDEALVEVIQPLLSENEVTARYQPQTEAIDKIMQEMEQSVFGGEPDMIPGLLHQKGVSPELVGSLFSAARAFYQAEPWTQLSNFDILALQVTPQKKPYYVIVMGQGGEEYGLSVYKNWKQVEEFFTAINPFTPLPSGERHAFLFNRPPFVSIDDLDAIEKYGWELPEPLLIPTPSIYMTRKIKRPDAAMLRWYEAALRAIPKFVADHLTTNPDGTHPPVETDLEVETAAGTVHVNIRYPGGDLSEFENSLAPWISLEDEDDELYMRLGEEEETDEAGAPLINILRSKQVNSDPALDKAQQIMYDAWEEPRPARRIALAKKALKTSPNCADAYVLLAVEDSKTHEESLALYQSGVEAGRRALGEGFLNDPDNIGNFWGILETRPFMRALEGLASIQWEMGQHEEAERNFRELLRLNPGDNQGIRFLLLNLLLELGQDDQARALLKEYPNDWIAEASYTAALLAFREMGDSPESRKMLNKAAKMNKHVPAYLTGKKQIPLSQSDFIILGGADEAAGYAAEYLKYWRETPGAIEWLEKVRQKRK